MGYKIRFQFPILLAAAAHEYKTEEQDGRKKITDE